MGDFISFLPLIVSLVGLHLFVKKQNKSYPQIYFTQGMLLFVLYFIADGLYLLKTPNYYAIAVANILCMFCTPVIPYIFLAYIRSLFRNASNSENLAISLLPSLALSFGTLIIYAVIGFDNVAAYLQAMSNGDVSEFLHPAYSMISFWTQGVYSTVLGLSIAIFIIDDIIILIKSGYRFGTFTRFLIGKGTYSTKYFQAWIFLLFCILTGSRLYLGEFLTEYPMLSMSLSLLTSIMLMLAIACAMNQRVENRDIKSFFKYRKPADFGNPIGLISKNRSLQELNKIPLDKLMLENNAQRIYSLVVMDEYYKEVNANADEAAHKLRISTIALRATVETMCHCSFEDLINYCKAHYQD